ncbi:isocitrate/isopropylmalate family dehydrogenase [Anaerovorax odorimutans]|uniref:isocitrate/isopropylmalate family dehydrogenase n=1 Tax=Anaerovorax odorimutans TaxID=109327 RepID=UPI00040340F4|nr:isocitrate/isopropylmalate family dehydrogenase [Anaerovorax odorimutans]
MDYIKAFEKIVEEQIARVEKMKNSDDFTDYNKIDKIIIGIIDGDGIGPIILKEAKKVLNSLLKDEIESGKIELKNINGLTLENRIAKMETVPKDVLDEIKQCHILLKGPTTTPSKSDNLPNIESANVTLRRELDLFANVRPVTIPEKNIDWIFYRENTEGEYTLGSKGVDINNEISMDFKVTTDYGTRRIAKAAFEYSKANGNQKVSIITKANIMKKTDGKFLDICYDVAKNYKDIPVDDWYVDITAANLVNEQIRSDFHVFILPNLYGDIITDEAAQIQGGVGTAGSANVGSKYAMFEAIHGSAPRMVADGVAEYANPSSILKAAEMLLRHIGYAQKANLLSSAINYAEENTIMTIDGKGNTAAEFSDYVLSKIK